jgi:hypothetical protein
MSPLYVGFFQPAMELVTPRPQHTAVKDLEQTAAAADAMIANEGTPEELYVLRDRNIITALKSALDYIGVVSRNLEAHRPSKSGLSGVHYALAYVLRDMEFVIGLRLETLAFLFAMSQEPQNERKYRKEYDKCLRKLREHTFSLLGNTVKLGREIGLLKLFDRGLYDTLGYNESLPHDYLGYLLSRQYLI